MNDVEREKIVVTALASQYPKIWHWQPTEIAVPYGADDREHIARFSESLRNMQRACIKALVSLPDEELLRMRDFQNNSEGGVHWPWRDHLPSNPNDYLTRLPEILAYGFGHPSFSPDFEYWVLMPGLSLMEATLLSVGADPSFMTSESLYRMRKEKPKNLWASLRFLIARHELLFRMYPSGIAGKMNLDTRLLYKWFKETRLDIHPGFKAALEKRFESAPVPAPPKETTNAEKASMLKLIAAMAIEQYSYDPKAQRNEAVQNISDDLDGLGIGLDAKTIRKWLKEACDLIEPKNIPK